MELIDRIEKNARAIKAVFGLMILITGLVYGFCIFIYQTKECTRQVNELKIQMAATDTRNATTHKEIESRIDQNEKNFQMTATKLDVNLIKISADLQFIKEQLIRKGMDK